MKEADTGVLHRWKHDDYAVAVKEVWDSIGDISGFEIFANQVLLAAYVRPVMSKTSGGIITGESSQKEDNIQGKIGLIIKVGPDAFRASETDDYCGRLPMVGDWVMVRVYDTFPISLKFPGSKDRGHSMRAWDGWKCRLVEANEILARVQLPHTVV